MGNCRICHRKPEKLDPRFDFCYFAGIVYDLKGNVVRLDNGIVLEYLSWEVTLDISDEENGYTTVFPIPEKIRLMTSMKHNSGY